MDARATNKWPAGCRTIVERNLPYNCRALLRQANEPTVSIQDLMTHDLVISYEEITQVFIVWNACLHSLLHSGETIVLTHGSKYGLNKTFSDSEGIAARYVARNNTRRIGNLPNETAYEKITFVKPEYLQEFCRHYEDYIYPDVEDEKFCAPAIIALPNTPICFLTKGDSIKGQLAILRQRDTITRSRRDPHFREIVLRKYNNTCLICGTQETKILEAAHIISIYDGGNDDVSNGLCLCRNHHKLYDSGLLEIDLENNTFHCISKSEKQMSWYHVAEKRDFELFRPSRQL